MDRDELLRYLDDLLQAGEIQDYSYNGLQVEGRPKVKRVVTGVSACAELFQFAVEQGADAVLVHHGLLWQGQEPRVRGFVYRRHDGPRRTGRDRADRRSPASYRRIDGRGVQQRAAGTVWGGTWHVYAFARIHPER